jgi:hypothetical protein
LDKWITAQPDSLSRPEAVRRLLEQAISRASAVKTPSKRKAQKASELADRAAEHIVDKAVPAEERQRRKRALIKGPKEFREIRGDLPDPKKG